MSYVCVAYKDQLWLRIYVYILHIEYEMYWFSTKVRYSGFIENCDFSTSEVLKLVLVNKQ